MRTRSQSRRRRQQQTLPVVENFDLEEPIVEQNVVPMADNRTMAQMLQAPIEGYEDAIVIPPINANNFELKQPLINLVQSNKFTDGEARDWLDKEPPRSILTWDDLPNEAFNKAGNVLRTPFVNVSPWLVSNLPPPETFYNSLNKMPQEGLAIIESKSKVRYSRSRANDSRVSTDAPLSNSSPSNNSFRYATNTASLEIR
ncbi:hypothetical protein Tco_0822878 [Tanacetum coccineum]|uniref:Reverse transcriptase domain-containing protein n=1 Tax=Tanacetum coccineum TaxID=301880 RepID=A0ABQ5AKV9_9ASTR